MRIAVVGAAGRTGVRVVRHALERGHDVVALARSAEHPADLDDPRVTVVEGDATDPAALVAVFDGVDAAVSALGAPPEDLVAANRAVVDAAVEEGVPRLVVIAQVGVLLKKVRPEFQAIADAHRASVAALRASAIAWVAACPAGLTDDPPTGSYQVVVEARAPEWVIGRDDLADFLLDAAESGAYDGHAVGVSRSTV